MSGPGPRQTDIKSPGRAGAGGPVPRRLGRLRARARLALLWESLWPRAWPALGVTGVFLVLALSGFFLLLSPLAHLVLLAVLIAALVLALMRGARGFARPGDEAADRRLERSSGLAHRPLTALLDRPAGGDAAAQALWRAHQAREAARIRSLRVGLPRPGLAARDPRALRTGLAIALLASVVVAGAEAPERLRRALWPAGPVAAPPLAAKLEAWVTPPAYTGAPPVFLDPAGGSVTVPAGSRLRAVLSGGPAVGTAPELLRDGTPIAAFQPLGPGSHSTEAVLDAGGRLIIRQGGGEVAGWTVAVQADAPPRIAFAEPPAAAARGLATRIPFRAEDDWGVASAVAEIRLAARPEAPPLSIDLPLPPGAPKAPRGVAQPDLSAHPWAGLAVRLRLVARDGAGQEGRSEEAALTLPERSFNHPVARGLVLLRKGLSLDPNARGRAMEGLDRLSEQPQAFENDTATALALRSARGRLEDARPEAVGEAQQTMWDTALALEEGRADRTSRALAETRERLREALRERERQERERAESQRQEQEARREAERQEEARRQAEANSRNENQPPGENRDQAARQQEQQQAQREAEAQQREAARDAQRQETDRRIQELREAVRRHLDALAERLQRENGEDPAAPRPRARQQEQREAERRTDRMREQNRQDRPEEAERELAELEKMLEDLENGRMAENQREERRQRRERGQQQMGVIQDMVRRESRLLDGAHQRSESDAARREQARRPAYPWNRNQPPPEPPAAAPPPTADARTQRALRRALGELMQQQGDLTGDVPAPLGRADQAMRESAEALSGGGDPRPHQERAIRELSEGGRQMAQRMQRQFGRPDQGEPGEGQEGEGQGDAMAEGGEQGGEGQDQMAQNGEGRDPLGRRLREGTGTAEEGGDTRVPDEAEILRTRRLQEELRRRLAERERSTTELDYIDRLLRLF
ncbi:DUF4175 domain-containing protein [Pararoseomonas indoligenes]|uniref:DUF4175 family protein n=1 Tax=Roseomonas indoligenes TaxID=2820811 RepID=A0A940MY21_9PROT|nr:DUF4175 family protein [Pararoseomonas indoligenes]MBP0493778.1 DUF4175 family protein [Pararoseomonas indoligenes]